MFEGSPRHVPWLLRTDSLFETFDFDLEMQGGIFSSCLMLCVVAIEVGNARL